MLASQIPAKVPLPFASSGTKNAIPTASQIGITPGAASLTDGFPPLTFTPLASGGVPPAGADFNGIFNLITAVQQWQCAGGAFKYDAAFSTAIGGYPKGAVLISTSNDINWLNLADSNTTNPDATDGSAANWTPLDAYGIAAVTGLTNANVTLTPGQYGKPIITLAGTLTGNVQIIFPTTTQQWTVVNNTTGAFAVTCKTAAGTGAAVAQGALQQFIGNGTDLVPTGISQTAGDARYAALAGILSQVFRVANAVGANDAVPLGQADGRYAKLAGLATQLFSVANATGTAHAVPLGQADGRYAAIAAAAPIPTTSLVAGQVAALGLGFSSVTIPSGGTWMYFIISGPGNGTLNAMSPEVGIVAGGTVLTKSNSYITGFTWRIA